MRRCRPSHQGDSLVDATGLPSGAASCRRRHPIPGRPTGDPGGGPGSPTGSTRGAASDYEVHDDECNFEQATTRPTSVWTDWSPAQCRIRTTAPFGRPQTLLLVGELDVATAVLGRRQLREALEMGRGPLVLDCSSVRFIDAAWLGVLVSTARYARQLGRKVSVAAPSPRVLRVLRLVGLEWLLGDERGAVPA